MLIYEVNLQINKNVYLEYVTWLEKHIQEILCFPGFNKALLLKEQNTLSSTHANITVQYHIDSQENLNIYLTKHAPQMRADGLKKFKNKFTATRRIFIISEVFPKHAV